MFPHVVGETSDVGTRVTRDRCCMIDFRGLADIRAAIATLVGAAVVAVVLVAGASWSVAMLVGWEAAATVFLAWVGVTIVRMDAAEKQGIAAREDSRVAA